MMMMVVVVVNVVCFDIAHDGDCSQVSPHRKLVYVWCVRTVTGEQGIASPLQFD